MRTAECWCWGRKGRRTLSSTELWSAANHRRNERGIVISQAMLRFIFLSLLAFNLGAQDRIGTVQVRVSTDRSDWRYDPGQPVRFRIVAIQDGHALSGIKVTYRIGPEMLPPKVDQTATLTDDG